MAVLAHSAASQTTSWTSSSLLFSALSVSYSIRVIPNTVTNNHIAVDVLLFLAAVVVLKDRAQSDRYRLIDAKSGFGAI